jgi:hypothetical protein
MIEFANMENMRNLHIEEKKRREWEKKELKEEANKRLEYIDAGWFRQLRLKNVAFVSF